MSRRLPVGYTPTKGIPWPKDTVSEDTAYRKALKAMKLEAKAQGIGLKDFMRSKDWDAATTWKIHKGML